MHELRSIKKSVDMLIAEEQCAACEVGTLEATKDHHLRDLTATIVSKALTADTMTQTIVSYSNLAPVEVVQVEPEAVSAEVAKL